MTLLEMAKAMGLEDRYQQYLEDVENLKESATGSDCFELMLEEMQIRDYPEFFEDPNEDPEGDEWDRQRADDYDKELDFKLGGWDDYQGF